ncbi:hypothetical protein [Nocardia aurantia]|nr:hypothetical protein [Nocardia aurantia]
MNSPTTNSDPAGQVGSLVTSPRTEVPECIAASVPGRSTGVLPALRTVGDRPAVAPDPALPARDRDGAGARAPVAPDLPAAASKLFWGRDMATIEDIRKRQRGIRADRVVVCRGTVNVGMLPMRTRRVAREAGRL